jgi:signal transduction histidine kinase
MKLTTKLIISITLVTIIIGFATVNFFWVSQKQILMQQAHTQAKTLFEMLVVTRQWVAENRDEIVPVPAVATKQLSQYAKSMTDFRFHITSDMLINDDNAPDDFEIRALAEFRKEKREYSETATIDNEHYYRYMAPLYVNEACMECHEYQGYKTGDLRGGISIMIPMKQIEAALEQNNRNYYMIGAISFIGIIITIIVLLKFFILKNIETLRDAAVSYRTGDFSKEVKFTTRDEIQELAEAFEVMRQSIVENEENLKSELAKVQGRYTSVMDELRQRNDELKNMNLFKTDILDSLAHELRTPLTKIMAYSNLLIQQGLNCDRSVTEKSLEAINRSSKLLNTLFSEIITLSRLDSNQYPYHFIPVDISKLMAETASIYEKDITDKNITLTMDIPAQTNLCLDGESFRHVVNNLMSNAVKFNKLGGGITIRYSETESGRILEFEDTGAGVPADEIDQIRKRFFRGSNVKREYPGTGLGLSIVSRIVEGHKGRLEIISEVGAGSVFRIVLPADLPCSSGIEICESG